MDKTYFTLWHWNGMMLRFKANHPPSAKDDPTRIGGTIRSYVLTDEQAEWTTAELLQGVEFGVLEELRT